MAYTFSLSRRSIPVRCLCLLLAVLVLWCFFMVPRAGAVATEAATVAYAGALIGTILVGAGVVFSSHGDMQAVGAAMYKSWIKSSNAIGSTISAIASWALEHGEAVAKGALRVGKDMYQAVVDAFNADYDSGSLSFGGDFVGASRFVNSQSVASSLGKIMKEKRVKEFTFSGSDESGSGCVFLRQESGYVRAYMRTIKGTSIFGEFDLSDYGGVTPADYYIDGGAITSDSMFFYTHVVGASGHVYGGSGGRIYMSFTMSFPGCPVENVLASDLAYPSDNTLVRMPDIPSVDTATGEAVFPLDAAYTKDAVAVPYPVDAEGVKVPDIPYDKVVDQSTGKTLDDADTGTDTKPGEGAGTETGSGVSGLIGTIIGLLKNFFDSPSDFKLDMDGFRDLAIADKFPFCIPFDMVDSVKQFAATAADYQFRIKFDTQYFSVDHTVDLTPIAVPLAFFRYIVCVWFVWVLMSRTHDLMKW